MLIGASTVFIGNPAVGPDGMAIQIPPLCAFLKDFGNAATGGTLSRLRGEYKMSPSGPVSAQPVEERPSLAFNAHTVVIRGHSVTIYEPVGGAIPPTWLPSADSIAQGLATLSDEQLRNVKEVYICPYPRVDKPEAVADYANGRIRVFSRSVPHPQSDLDWMLQHESGHGYSISEVWTNDPAAQAAWIRAIDEDHRRVTDYGNTDEVEDFAEFMVMFASVKGTPCEASAKALFPHRWAIMEKLFPNGMPTRNPRYTSKKF